MTTNWSAKVKWYVATIKFERRYSNEMPVQLPWVLIRCSCGRNDAALKIISSLVNGLVSMRHCDVAVYTYSLATMPKTSMLSNVVLVGVSFQSYVTEQDLFQVRLSRVTQKRQPYPGASSKRRKRMQVLSRPGRHSTPFQMRHQHPTTRSSRRSYSRTSSTIVLTQ